MVASDQIRPRRPGGSGNPPREKGIEGEEGFQTPKKGRWGGKGKAAAVYSLASRNLQVRINRVAEM